MNPIEDAVLRLLRARREGILQPAPELPDADAAYVVQAEVARQSGWFADGGPGHWKSGGPSREAVPTHAPLPPAGVWRSPAQAGDWPFHRRAVEAEIALRLREPVDAGRALSLDTAGTPALVGEMCVSIEIVDSRWVEGADAPAWAKLADMASHGALILGAWTPFVARDWSSQVCRVQVGDQPVRAFEGTHSMGDPLHVVPRWLRHATRDGAVVPAGTVVTTGSWCGVIEAAAGDSVQVSFDGIGEARLTL
jgi:2-keto-4-pentenoate hydratase